MSDRPLEIHIRHALLGAGGKMPMDLSLRVDKGAILALTGPSGVGKTTLLKQIAGLIQPETGKITFGKNVWFDSSAQINIPAQQRKTGFVFQDYALFPHLTVQNNLLFALPKGNDNKIVGEILESIDLSTLADRKPSQLSGGQQQRVAIARALVSKPDLLLLDEPMSALDTGFRKTVQDILADFHRKYQFTMIMVTHNIGDIFRIADQVAVMDQGRITRCGTPKEVYLNENTEEEEGLILYGEVVSCSILQDHVLVSAMIQDKIRALKLPLHMQKQLQPGIAFALPYTALPGQIRIITPGTE
ncbi:Vitamin B12 import ATP-binding protein BtuD [Dyadobacter sp. CECT 9275]|uniref:Vitamin B12 import ATP-binding protein BtuD n=1 Tax=Dyadobacter helix TaxID=2822344 RepID=A0A916J7K8_9BACT|nr:ABC transporter ATP-binding protein [Dyadobacter sp. CECT 9275]CAG4990366.1 Vitamin B12 import ATP-binding protein BtuD [Dyadobacter sp. CECT 9275]